MSAWLQRLILPREERKARAARHVKDGQALESAGDVRRAETAYRRALELVADDIDAAYLLGRLCGQSGRLAEGEQLLRRVAQEVPRFAPARRDYGLILHALGRTAEALEHYAAAALVDPTDAVVQLNAAIASFDLGDLEVAEAGLRALIDNHGDIPGAAERLGSLLIRRGRPAEAAALLREAQQQRPSAETAYNLGAALLASGDAAGALAQFESAVEMDADHFLSLRALGRLSLHDGLAEQAERWLKRAVDADPAQAEAYDDLGLALLQQGRWDEAREAFEFCLKVSPDYRKGRFNRALTEIQARRYSEAERLYRALVGDLPDDAEAHSGLGSALQRLGRFEEAEVEYRRALALAPDLSEALNNLGITLQEMGEFEAAIKHFEDALTRRPDFAIAQNNLGLAYVDCGRIDDALACFERALELDPGLEETRFNRAVARLRIGDFRRGWDDYEKRWAWKFATTAPYEFPAWDGSPLRGRRLLVYHEQGLGDEIMFASCYGDLLSQDGQIVIECSTKLEKLFARSFPKADVRVGSRNGMPGWISELSPFDAQIACGSLPGLFRRDREAFPEHRGYLRADPDRVDYWKDRLRSIGQGLKIGVSWRGGAVKTRRRLRSLALADMAPLFRMPDAEFISLQYTDCGAEIASLAQREGIVVHHWQEAIDDYDETAALVCALDGIVTVCTAIVHLGGALGRPVRVMVPYAPEWRYMARGERMPWYPSVRLFRQPSPGDWGSVLEAVRGSLESEIARAGEAGVGSDDSGLGARSLSK
jgi:tetratricopeptide (TPR) repeat protein